MDEQKEHLGDLREALDESERKIREASGMVYDRTRRVFRPSSQSDDPDRVFDISDKDLGRA